MSPSRLDRSQIHEANNGLALETIQHCKPQEITSLWSLCTDDNKPKSCGWEDERGNLSDNSKMTLAAARGKFKKTGLDFLGGKEGVRILQKPS